MAVVSTSCALVDILATYSVSGVTRIAGTGKAASRVCADPLRMAVVSTSCALVDIWLAEANGDAICTNHAALEAVGVLATGTSVRLVALLLSGDTRTATRATEPSSSTALFSKSWAQESGEKNM